jgi:CRISPR-associated protein Csm2
MENNKEDKSFKRIQPDPEKLKKIIKEKDAKELNSYASELGDHLGYELRYFLNKERIKTEKALSSSQIRNILDEIQRMHKFDKNKLQLIRPKLAYAAGRHGGRVKEFQQIMEKAIELVEDENDFEFFKNFVEAIVAYHRFYGGE